LHWRPDFHCRHQEAGSFHRQRQPQASSKPPSMSHGLSTALEPKPVIFNLIGYSSEVLVAPLFGYETVAFQTGWFIGLFFLLILFLNRIRPRFWCRVLCPLGALLGVCSKYSMVRLKKSDDKCNHCGICTRNCQGAASCEPGTAWQSTECLLCLNCWEVCPDDALTFKLERPRSAAGKTRFDSGRRVVLTGLLAGVSIPFLGKLDGITHRSPSPELIRPPGALAENDFLERCLRCGLCMKACPTNAIHPAFTEAGVAGFWTPNLIMTLGYCEYTCTLCGSVCPTGAIKEITSEIKTKTPVRIGSAYIDRGRCLPWAGTVSCIMCEEVCPTSPKAIYLQDEHAISPDKKMIPVKRPYINLKQCVGCGICENKCPVRGRPAIRVISAGESRDPDNQILL
jgi:MauM/NapG family ferredoxin protein